MGLDQIFLKKSMDALTAPIMYLTNQSLKETAVVTPIYKSGNFCSFYKLVNELYTAFL